jgi:hypothetical protein
VAKDGVQAQTLRDENNFTDFGPESAAPASAISPREVVIKYL